MCCRYDIKATTVPPSGQSHCLLALKSSPVHSGLMSFFNFINLVSIKKHFVEACGQNYASSGLTACVYEFNNQVFKTTKESVMVHKRMEGNHCSGSAEQKNGSCVWVGVNSKCCKCKRFIGFMIILSGSAQGKFRLKSGKMSICSCL